MEENKPVEPIVVNDKRLSVPEEPKLPQTTDSNQVLITAMNKGYEPEFIEKMLDLQERHQKELARQAFYDDLANFKAEAPPVKKDKYNKFFDSWYTSLGQLLDTYNPVLGKHGLSISFPPVEQTDKTLTVECRLSHRMGHSEGIQLSGPIDQAAVGKQSGKRSRNPIQDIKSTFTYLRSATCEAILGVAGTEGTMDDDGNSAGGGIEYISTDQCTEIDDMLAETYKSDEKTRQWLDYMKVESTDKIPAGKYKMAINSLKRAKGVQ